jgi:WD40 repeat protein
MDIKLSRILVSSPNKEISLFDMKSYTKDNPGNCKKGYFALEDVASAVAIGDKHYFAALEFERTIVYYEFVGQGGVYFKMVNRFKNKYLHKEPIMAMQVDDKESSIVTVGGGSDTFIRVWNLKGEKLAEINTSQVEHYQASFGENYLMLRSWTTELKIYNIVFAKDSKEFSKIEKGAELSHSDGVLTGACDMKAETAVSLRKDRTIQLWKVDMKTHSSKVKKVEDHVKFGHGDLSVCAIHSVEN